jgi:hypothetical protein
MVEIRHSYFAMNCLCYIISHIFMVDKLNCTVAIAVLCRQSILMISIIRHDNIIITSPCSLKPIHSKLPPVIRNDNMSAVVERVTVRPPAVVLHRSVSACPAHCSSLKILAKSKRMELMNSF